MHQELKVQCCRHFVLLVFGFTDVLGSSHLRLLSRHQKAILGCQDRPSSLEAFLKLRDSAPDEVLQDKAPFELGTSPDRPRSPSRTGGPRNERHGASWGLLPYLLKR